VVRQPQRSLVNPVRAVFHDDAACGTVKIIMDIFDRILLLKNSIVFAQCVTDDLRYVAMAMDEESYLAGETVFDIGENGERMYLIKSGMIGISLNQDRRQKNFVATLGPGECFGEMNLLDQLPRSATAHVVSDAALLSLSTEHFHQLILRYPELALGMLASLSKRLRETNKFI
jgi:CRP/FNR family transcriptional regulator/CRP/FNR family cyclic AMP-dependent transcriptional regulator